ncbi:phosphate signaling complex protein PhoU [Desulfobacca acetoxidans]|uniref:Phosphate-specific transport system accessory protein PhoU n=1 Tax=Desulfobacca acetoxidans (strain ATCC 700848 / DSM 11109 / ASRB2) TaxID=880072 RepID=F2NDW0_DESAR|nr:phosphate signaling complex protein PhoU [Desulfobacca acetoxidans]AEB10457.1 phosphate uptake regulator, PhoU [Desulfobacca acetoxidans DSM 11109]
MTRTLELEINFLKKKILSVCTIVEENVRDAVKALVKRDTDLAAKVIDADEEIDALEVEIEEECLKTLALHQPVARDLRFIIAVFNINNDLERIGDLAVNIAERAMSLASCANIDIPFDYTSMAEKVLLMVKKSLDALVQMNPELGREVCEEDDEVDVMNREAYSKVQERIRLYPERVDCLIQLPAISSELERIADHATNIAEEVIYLAKGEIVRHKIEKPQLRVVKSETGNNFETK